MLFNAVQFHQAEIKVKNLTETLEAERTIRMESELSMQNEYKAQLKDKDDIIAQRDAKVLDDLSILCLAW